MGMEQGGLFPKFIPQQLKRTHLWPPGRGLWPHLWYPRSVVHLEGGLPEKEGVGEVGGRGQGGGGLEGGLMMGTIEGGLPGGETRRGKVWRWHKEERGEQ